MREDTEVLGIILDTARNDERIEAVILNGSRANPNVPRDRYMDFDIAYVVKETASFIADKKWIDRFGEKLVFQFPDELDALMGKKVDFGKCYSYLMQFADGSRIDLHIETLDEAKRELDEEKLSVVLLDKHSLLPMINPPSDIDYWVKKPSSDEFYRCCNEFWWVSLYVAKGLVRDEILFAMRVLDEYVRPEMLMLLSWHAGIRTNFSLSVGKCCKYIKKYIEPELYDRYIATYPHADVEECWKALFEMGKLFYELEGAIANKLGFSYDAREAENAMWFARKMKMGLI